MASNLVLRLFYLLLALLPGLLWLRHYYLRDIFEPEPKALVARLFGLGALGFGAAYLLQSAIYNLDSQHYYILQGKDFLPAALRAFLVVASTEELIKLLIVYVFIFKNPEFDEPMDGVVYSIACALGFSTVENANYMYTYDTFLVVRMLFSCFLHAGCSGLAGYYLGRAKFSESGRFLWCLQGLVLAWLLHGLYDFFVFSELYMALILIIILLWLVKEFLDSRIDDALERSPFKDAPQV